MTDLYSLGYPEGYRLGLSFVLWAIYIAVSVILGIFLYLNARKSNLINVKENFRAKSFLYICGSIAYSLVQVGVWLPDNFLHFFIVGTLINTFSGTIYFYYWEKNLTRIKRIPTVSAAGSFIVSVIGVISIFFFLDLASLLLNPFFLIGYSLSTLSFVFYCYLIYLFSKHVKGVANRRIGTLWIGGIIMFLSGFFLDSPSGVLLVPEFIVVNIAPILAIVGMIIPVYCVNKYFVHVSSYYIQTQRCAVHRGDIGKGNPLYSCPSCGMVYCMSCYNQVIQKEGCWNCGEGGALEGQKERNDEPILESKKKSTEQLREKHHS
jgi:hypothetical protein